MAFRAQMMLVLVKELAVGEDRIIKTNLEESHKNISDAVDRVLQWDCNVQPSKWATFWAALLEHGLDYTMSTGEIGDALPEHLGINDLWFLDRP